MPNSSRLLHRLLPAAVLIGALAVLGCAEGDGSPNLDGAGPPLPTANQFALILEVSAGEIVFDPAEFLSGEVAARAAQEDGFIAAGESLPNDYYIRNRTQETISLPVGEEFQATLLAADTLQPATPIDFQSFRALFSGERSAEGYYGFVPEGFPMYITLRGDLVIAASQSYLP